MLGLRNSLEEEILVKSLFFTAVCVAAGVINPAEAQPSYNPLPLSYFVQPESGITDVYAWRRQYTWVYEKPQYFNELSYRFPQPVLEPTNMQPYDGKRVFMSRPQSAIGLSLPSQHTRLPSDSHLHIPQ